MRLSQLCICMRVKHDSHRSMTGASISRDAACMSCMVATLSAAPAAPAAAAAAAPAPALYSAHECCLTQLFLPQLPQHCEADILQRIGCNAGAEAASEQASHTVMGNDGLHSSPSSSKTSQQQVGCQVSCPVGPCTPNLRCRSPRITSHVCNVPVCCSLQQVTASGHLVVRPKHPSAACRQ